MIQKRLLASPTATCEELARVRADGCGFARWQVLVVSERVVEVGDQPV